MVIDIFSILFMLYIFWLADFVFQNDKMAINKSTSNKALLYHTLTHSLVMLCGMFLWSILGLAESKYFWSLGAFAIINLVTHTVIDYVTSRINSMFWKAEKRHEFFTNIGFDQLLHYTIMFITSIWLFKFTNA